MALDTVKYPNRSCQPEVVNIDLELTGVNGAAPTAAAGADNDNRLISSIGRTSAGIYTLVFSQVGRKLIGASICPTTPVSANYIMKACSLSSSTVTLTLISDAAAALDIVASDVVRLNLRFKNQGA
jgi:hypothetical protein